MCPQEPPHPNTSPHPHPHPLALPPPPAFVVGDWVEPASRADRFTKPPGRVIRVQDLPAPYGTTLTVRAGPTAFPWMLRADACRYAASP